MRIEALTAEKAEAYRKEIAQFYYENAISCSCLDHYTYDAAYDKMGSLIDHLRDDTAVVFGAFHDEEIVGFVWAYTHQFREENRMYVNEIHVKEEYRNRGIGSQLLKLVEDKATEQKLGALYLHVEANNPTAVRVYQKCGYSIERIQLKKSKKQDNHYCDE